MSVNKDRFLDHALWAMQNQRMIVIRAQTFVNIQKTIEQEYGDDADAILYEAGIEAGRSSTRILMEEWHERHMEFISRWSEFYGSSGVGWFELESVRSEGICVANIKINRSFIAEFYGKSKVPICHFLAGFFVGVFWESCGTKLSCEEIYCEAKGDTNCTFIFEPI